MMPNHSPPIACTLSANDFNARLASIAERNRHSLLSVTQDGGQLSLVYDAAARLPVESMITRERDCCAFLTFEVQQHEREMVVRISAPTEAHEAAEMLLDQFSSKSAMALPGCGCDPR
jgi:hypothetical protein